jgi:hypothetical protein
MLEMLKSNKNAMLISNIAGIVSGVLIAVTAVCLLTGIKRRNSICGRAKRAFKTIENKIAV